MERMAREIGLSGANVARTLQRIETGEALADADIVAAIFFRTGGEVTALDISGSRLEWLQSKGRNRFSTPDAVSSPASSSSDPVPAAGSEEAAAEVAA